MGKLSIQRAVIRRVMPVRDTGIPVRQPSQSSHMKSSRIKSGVVNVIAHYLPLPSSDPLSDLSRCASAGRHPGSAHLRRTSTSPPALARSGFVQRGSVSQHQHAPAGASQSCLCWRRVRVGSCLHPLGARASGELQHLQQRAVPAASSVSPSTRQ